jgi:endonuclease YncB( thermonuclease family)
MAIPKPGFRQRSAAAATMTACLLFAHGAAAETAEPCRFEARGRASAAAILDGRNIRLTDGRAIKLAGIDIPHEPGSRAAQASKQALENLLLGKDILLAAPSGDTDRYGRTLAFVFVNGSETPVQYNLLSLGHARVSAQLQDNARSLACLSALFAQERKAREARIGLWGDPGYAVRAAGDGPAIRPLRGRFSVAEGRVVSVRDSGGTIYVNFGRRWSEALTVTILKRHERSFAAAGIEPKTLEGRLVRVRGYVDVRSGPVIEATRPEQIEIAAR